MSGLWQVQGETFFETQCVCCCVTTSDETELADVMGP